MKVIIDKEACIGCGLCPQLAPEVFKMEGDKAVVLAQPASVELEVNCDEAAKQCPVGSIKVET